MAKPLTEHYPEPMVTDENDNTAYDELRAAFARDSAALARQRNALTKAEAANRELAKRLLRAGYDEKRPGFRADVQKISVFSMPTIRALADEAGIPPDERYVKAAKVRKARETAEPVPAALQPRTEPQPWPGAPAKPLKPKLSPRVEHLDPRRAARAAALAESRADGGWAARVIAEHPGLSANWHPYVVVEAGLHRGFIEDDDLSG